jgi:hypothetical protein
MLYTFGDGLLGTGGNSATASDTGRELGIDDDGSVTSSDTGREFRTGVDCADSEVSLLWAERAVADVMEPSAAVNEECRDASGPSSDGFDDFLCLLPVGVMVRLGMKREICGLTQRL